MGRSRNFRHRERPEGRVAIQKLDCFVGLCPPRNDGALKIF